MYMYCVYLPPVYTVFLFNSWLQDIRPGSSCRFGVQRTLRCPIMAVLIALTSLGRIMRISSAWKAMKPKVCWLKRRIAFIPLREDFIHNCFSMVDICGNVATGGHGPWMQKNHEKSRRTLTQGTATGIQLPTWRGRCINILMVSRCEAAVDPWNSCPDPLSQWSSDPSSAVPMCRKWARNGKKLCTITTAAVA